MGSPAENAERARQLKEEAVVLARRIAEGLPTDAQPPVMAIALSILAVRAFHLMDPRLSRFVTLAASLWEDEEKETERAMMEVVREVVNQATGRSEPAETKH